MKTMKALYPSMSFEEWVNNTKKGEASWILEQGSYILEVWNTEIKTFLLKTKSKIYLT